jgi:hypothetical protein
VTTQNQATNGGTSTKPQQIWGVPGYRRAANASKHGHEGQISYTQRAG